MRLEIVDVKRAVDTYPRWRRALTWLWWIGLGKHCRLLSAAYRKAHSPYCRIVHGYRPRADGDYIVGGTDGQVTGQDAEAGEAGPRRPA